MLRIVGITCGLLISIIAMAVMIGWKIHSITLVQLQPEFSPMKFNTALCFLLCAVNLIFFKSSIRILRSLGFIAAIFCLLTMSQYLFKMNLGIDTLFDEPFTLTNTLFSGRMSPTAALLFMIMGTLLAVGANIKKRGWLGLRIIIVASIVMAFALVPLLAYVSGIQAIYPWNFLTRMSVLTSVSFILICIGLLCHLWCNKSETSYSIGLPIVLCLLTATFGMTAAINSYEDLKYADMKKEQAYYSAAIAKKESNIQPYKSDFIHQKNTYISYFILLFGLMTSLLITLTIYFHIKWRQNLKALKNSEERLHLAMTGTTDGLYDWNVSTGKFYYSPRFEEVLGYPPNSLDPDYSCFLNLIHPDDKEIFLVKIDENIQNKSFVDMNFRMKNNFEKYLWFNFRGTPSVNHTGDLRITGFINDVSLRNEVDTMKNEFISTVSHELRTPMTAIGGSLKLILSGKLGKFDGKVSELLVIAERNCGRLLRLVNDILDIEKIEKGQIDFKLEVYELDKLISEVLMHNKLYAEKFDIRLVFTSLENIRVKVDPDRMLQVLTNLISNAIKFSKSHTEVKIIMQRIKNRVRVSVVDEGRGISDKFKERIFQKFAQADSSNTREKEGTGLGLSISKAIMEKLGGNLHFISNTDKGAVFFFELPIVE